MYGMSVIISFAVSKFKDQWSEITYHHGMSVIISFAGSKLNWSCLRERFRTSRFLGRARLLSVRLSRVRPFEAIPYSLATFFSWQRCEGDPRQGHLWDGLYSALQANVPPWGRMWEEDWVLGTRRQMTSAWCGTSHAWHLCSRPVELHRVRCRWKRCENGLLPRFATRRRAAIALCKL